MKKAQLFSLIIPVLFSFVGGGTEDTVSLRNDEPSFVYGSANFKNVSAMNEELETTDFGMTSYFENLHENVPTNIGSSCVYVAFVDVLCFYDTFQNDDIVDEKYEEVVNYDSFQEALKHSPGVFRYEYDRIDYSNQEVYNFIQNYKSVDLQCMLIDYLNDLKGTNYPRDNYQTGVVDDYQKLLDFLYGYGRVTYEIVDREDFVSGAFDLPENQEGMENYAKDCIDQGKPVILTGVRYDAENNEYVDGHAFIAYDYDEDGLICNFCQGKDRTALHLKEGIEHQWYITSVGSFDFSSIPFYHSKNYMVDNLKYCGCGDHVFHTYTEYIPGTMKLINTLGLPILPGDHGDIVLPEKPAPAIPAHSHKAICKCGYSVIERHYIEEGTSITGGYAYCDGCGDYTNLFVVR